MQLIIESVAETQKTSLAAVADFTDNYLLIVERMAQLHIEVSRTAFEQSAELALLCERAGLNLSSSAAEVVAASRALTSTELAA